MPMFIAPRRSYPYRCSFCERPVDSGVEEQAHIRICDGWKHWLMINYYCPTCLTDQGTDEARQDRVKIGKIRKPFLALKKAHREHCMACRAESDAKGKISGHVDAVIAHTDSHKPFQQASETRGAPKPPDSRSSRSGIYKCGLHGMFFRTTGDLQEHLTSVCHFPAHAQGCNCKTQQSLDNTSVSSSGSSAPSASASPASPAEEHVIYPSPGTEIPCRDYTWTFKTHEALCQHRVSGAHSRQAGDNMARAFDSHDCDQCGQSFNSGTALQEHLLHHTPSAVPHESFVCGICVGNVSFEHDDDWKAHVISHARASDWDEIHPTTTSPRSKYPCDICGESATFDREDILKAHIIAEHAPPPSEDLMYNCFICGRSFEHDSWKPHMRSHVTGEAERPTFSSNAHLNASVKVKAGDVADTSKIRPLLKALLREAGIPSYGTSEYFLDAGAPPITHVSLHPKISLEDAEDPVAQFDSKEDIQPADKGPREDDRLDRDRVPYPLEEVSVTPEQPLGFYRPQGLQGPTTATSTPKCPSQTPHQQLTIPSARNKVSPVQISHDENVQWIERATPATRQVSPLTVQGHIQVPIAAPPVQQLAAIIAHLKQQPGLNANLILQTEDLAQVTSTQIPAITATPSQSLQPSIAETPHEFSLGIRKFIKYGKNLWSQIPPPSHSAVLKALAGQCHTWEDLLSHNFIPKNASQSVGPNDPGHMPLAEIAYTPVQWDGLRKRRAVALDCEMVGCGPIGKDSEVALIYAVDYLTGEILVNKFVWPHKPIVNYRTQFSGVTPAAMFAAVSEGRALLGYEAARAELWKHVGPETILVGHSLWNDLDVLRMAHTRVVDSSILTKQAVGPSNKRLWSLKALCEDFVSITIQDHGLNGHDCMEDVLAAREVVLWCTLNPQQLMEWGSKVRAYQLHVEEQFRKAKERKANMDRKQAEGAVPAKGSSGVGDGTRLDDFYDENLFSDGSSLSSYDKTTLVIG